MVLTVKIRFGDYQTITRSSTLEAPTDGSDDVGRAALALLDRWASAGFRPVRLVGVTAGRLSKDEGQLELFEDPARTRRRRLDATIDAIRRRHGDASIHRAGNP